MYICNVYRYVYMYICTVLSRRQTDLQCSMILATGTMRDTVSWTMLHVDMGHSYILSRLQPRPLALRRPWYYSAFY